MPDTFDTFIDAPPKPEPAGLAAATVRASFLDEAGKAGLVAGITAAAEAAVGKTWRETV